MTTNQHDSVSLAKFQALLMEVSSKLGMRQGELADWLGYSESHISKVKNGISPTDRSLILLLETLLENHRLKQEVARVRGAAAELMGAAMPYPRHTEAPSTLVGTASLGARESRKQTPAEIFEAAKKKVLSQIPQAAAPTSPKPKPAREKTPPASSAPPAKGAQP
jgi:hypothetical protein